MKNLTYKYKDEISESKTRSYLPDVKEFKLDNGLTLLVVERHDSPVVTCFRFNSTSIIKSIAGMENASHLYEHMQFKGTEKVGTWNYEAEKPIMQEIEGIVDEIDRELTKEINAYQKSDKEKIDMLWSRVKELEQKQRDYIYTNELMKLFYDAGGYGLDAMCGFDNTIYYISLPSNKLEIWAFLEADRLCGPVFREFYSEREVLLEERRMLTNTPSRLCFEKLLSTMYPLMSFSMDVQSLRPEKLIDYVGKYYTPDKTVLVLIGDVDPQNAYEIIKKHFGNIPAGAELPPDIHRTDPQNEERRVNIEKDAQPLLCIGFHGPAPGHPDQYALKVISQLLSAGKTGRLYKELVRSGKAGEPECFLQETAITSFFALYGSPQIGINVSEVEEAFYTELEKLKDEPVSKWEMEKAMNQLDKQFISTVKTKFSLAQALSWHHYWTGDWRNFDNREKIRAVTADDIMRVANKYFVKTNRTVVTLTSANKTVSL
jgi:predicted Zn-dependent peptidase